jgi:hypothetical protein
VEARLKLKQREETYRIYVTDSLCVLLGNKIRYIDAITTVKEQSEPEDTRTVDEIVDSIWSQFEKKGG